MQYSFNIVSLPAYAQLSFFAVVGLISPFMIDIYANQRTVTVINHFFGTDIDVKIRSLMSFD